MNTTCHEYLYLHVRDSNADESSIDDSSGEEEYSDTGSGVVRKVNIWTQPKRRKKRYH